jgi:hypothetical protein
MKWTRSVLGSTSADIDRPLTVIDTFMTGPLSTGRRNRRNISKEVGGVSGGPRPGFAGWGMMK